MGVMPSPRSGGGPISLLLGEPPGLVPGGPGDRHGPHCCQNGLRPPANDLKVTPEALLIDLNPLVGYTYSSFRTIEERIIEDGEVFLKRKENAS